MHRFRRTAGALALAVLFGATSAKAVSTMPECDPMFPDCSEDSPWLRDPKTGMSEGFCARWNPDFAFTDGHCCGKAPRRFRVRGIRCAPERAKNSFCDEMTPEQREYVRAIKEGRITDQLQVVDQELALGSGEGQAQCDPDAGFLVRGRALANEPAAGLVLRRPDRCVNFGTDRLVAMLGWLARQLREHDPKTSLLVGDMSAPRGGALCGRGGRKGHSSHKNGQDADIGFYRPGIQATAFSTHGFDAEANWWLLKRIFNNPYVCVKVVFLDRSLIRKLRKEAGGDPEWSEFSRHIRHVRGHRNHLHVRVGQEPGQAGCGASDSIDLIE
ncbi:MAG TPA: penicillin-insensitive murein endopeptidase [Bdellovibrionota bacterium]|nr:penicillin-insensitive murein endopeptidase [Bdellovibrionota bacterium]